MRALSNTSSEKSKAKKPRPICWNCGRHHNIYKATHYSQPKRADVRDVGWYFCADCGATIQEKPSKLGEPLNFDKEAFWWHLSRLVYVHSRKIT